MAGWVFLERRVLVVLGDAAASAKACERDALLAALNGLGWRATGAASGASGLEALESAPAEVVISGCSLPDSGGLDFLAEVGRRWPQAQRILLHGEADQSILEEALGRGERLRLLSTPWHPAQLRMTVASALEQFDQAQLALPEDCWAQVFDAIDRPIAVLSQGLRVVRANRAWATLASASPETIAGGLCHRLLFSREAPCAGCNVARGQTGGTPIELHHGERSFTLASESVGPPAARRIVCVYRETTEEQRRVRQAVQAEKQITLKGLAGTLAHEINNPLGGILAFCQLMQRDPGRSGDDLEILHEIEQAAVRCKNTLAALLKLSRGGEGRACEVFDLNGAVLDAALLFRLHLAERKGIDFDTAPCSVPLSVRGNAALVEQAVVGMLSSSLLSCSKGGRIRLLTRRTDRLAEVIVEDDGEAVPAEDVARLFEARRTRQMGEATGAGLAASWKIAASHGGSLDVSRRSGRGNIYALRFPLPGRIGA